ncbi:MAG TPA: hypothetical protein PLI72_06485 [Smithellaceae bacterium]|jgi:hypothetical protein|nr:hypothetical protein [Paludibacter sp.]HQM43381.1 hypothetical protein [Smithellaceae bacterium]
MNQKYTTNISLPKIITMLLSISLALAGTIYAALEPTLQAWVMLNIPTSLLLLVPQLLLLLLIATILLAYSFYKSLQDPYRKDFTFDQASGISIKRKTGMFYCSNCLSKHIYSPLRKNKAFWLCTNKECLPCPDPNYVPPPAEPRRRVISEGLNWFK